jgi:hypothetical protein
VCDHVLDEAVIDALSSSGVDRYVRWDRVQGEWGEKHMCTHIWPGEYHVFLAMVPKDNSELLQQAIKDIRTKYPADEVWAWRVSLGETI